MIERAKTVINECLSAYYKKNVQADYSHLDRVHLCGEAFEFNRKTFQVDLNANLLDFTLVVTVNGWAISNLNIAFNQNPPRISTALEEKGTPESFLLLLPKIDLHGVLQDCVKATKEVVTEEVLEGERRLRTSHLAWMVVYGYTIGDLIEALERHRLTSSKTDIPSIFAEWEKTVGFDGDIWPLPQDSEEDDADDDEFWEDISSPVEEILSLIEDYHIAPDPDDPDFNASDIPVTDALLSDGSHCIVTADAINKKVSFAVDKNKRLCVLYSDFDVLLSDLEEILDSGDVETFYEYFRSRSASTAWSWTEGLLAGITVMIYRDERSYGESLDDSEDNSELFDINSDYHIKRQKQKQANVSAYENDPEYRSASDAIEARLKSIVAANLHRDRNGDTVEDEVYAEPYGEFSMNAYPGYPCMSMTPDDLIAIGTEMKRASKRGSVEICIVDAEIDDGESEYVPGIVINIPAEISEDSSDETATEPAEESSEPAETAET